MKTNKQLWNICMDIYKELYIEAQPSADFNKLIESGETKKPDWFSKYYLDDKEIKKIITKHTKKHKLNFRDRRAVYFEVWLGCSPTSYKKENTVNIPIRNITPNDKLKQTYKAINLDGTK